VGAQDFSQERIEWKQCFQVVLSPFADCHVDIKNIVDELFGGATIIWGCGRVCERCAKIFSGLKQSLLLLDNLHLLIDSTSEAAVAAAPGWLCFWSS
jgi:hypothetical protein